MSTHSVHVRPKTGLGRTSVALALAFLVLGVLWTSAPGAGRLAILAGAGSGVAAIAAIRRGERGLIVVAALLPLLAVVGFIVAQVIG